MKELWNELRVMPRNMPAVIIEYSKSVPSVVFFFDGPRKASVPWSFRPIIIAEIETNREVATKSHMKEVPKTMLRQKEVMAKPIVPHNLILSNRPPVSLILDMIKESPIGTIPEKKKEKTNMNKRLVAKSPARKTGQMRKAVAIETM